MPISFKHVAGGPDVFSFAYQALPGRPTVCHPPGNCGFPEGSVREALSRSTAMSSWRYILPWSSGVLRSPTRVPSRSDPPIMKKVPCLRHAGRAWGDLAHHLTPFPLQGLHIRSLKKPRSEPDNSGALPKVSLLRSQEGSTCCSSPGFPPALRIA